MKTSIYQLTLMDLLWMIIPLSVVIFIYLKWSDDKSTIFIALFRMVLQLLLIGYLLLYIFQNNSKPLTVIILSIMLLFASIIALRPLQKRDTKTYLKSFLAIFMGGVLTLIVVVFGVIKPNPWYEPRFLIPLAGMVFANSMNAVSIAAERYESESKEQNRSKKARNKAYKASLIPIINSLFAVGLVSLPGMMSGQILSGIDPLIAVRYQIMVMLMILSSAGLSSAIYLYLKEKF